MISNITIYPFGDEWAMLVRKSTGVETTISDWSTNHPELLQEILQIAESVKTKDEELLSIAYPILEANATNEDILKLSALIPDWKVGIAYTGTVVRHYQGNFYRLVQAHTSQTDWTPDVVPALWTKINMDEAVGVSIIDWYEPTSTHYFTIQDLMRYTDGLVYESLLFVNIYSPEQYPAGWKRRPDLD